MKDRFLLPREVLGLLGMHQIRFQGAINDGRIRPSAVRQFAGNGLHAGTVGAVVAWAAMNIRWAR